MKPRYRYNWKSAEWDELIRFEFDVFDRLGLPRPMNPMQDPWRLVAHA